MISLEFVRRQQEADDVVSFFFRPDRPLDFEAGEFLELSLPHTSPDSRGITRCLTIASAPSEPLVQFSTRVGAAPSTFKQALCALQPGDRVEAIGPFGEFLVEDASPVVFLAGGIGITPFRAMLLDLSARAERRPTTLLYSNSTPNIPFRDAFDSLTAGWPELELVYTVTRPSAGWHGPSGRIDAGLISQYVPDLSRSRFFVCGPAAFVEAVVGALHDLGVPAARITQEDFPGYEPAAEPSQAAA